MKGKISIKNTSIIFCSGLLLIASCNKEKPFVIPEINPPEPRVLHECPKDGDVYKLLFDTLIFNSKREMYTVDSMQIKYELDNAMPLGVCKKTEDLYGSAQYSPLAAKVKIEDGTSRDMKWDRFGYFRDMVLAEDIDRIVKLPDGKKIKFELSLLNHSRDTIQTSPITIIYKEKFPEK